MNYIIFALTSSLLLSSSILTMDQQVTHLSKKPRNHGPPVVIKQEEDDCEIEIKKEPMDVPVACAVSSYQNVASANYLPNRDVSAENNLMNAIEMGEIEEDDSEIEVKKRPADLPGGCAVNCFCYQNLASATSLPNRGMNAENHLVNAIEMGEIETVRQFLQRGDITVNFQLDGGLNPLIIAIQNGYADIVRLLLTRADISLRECGGKAPLIIAAQHGYSEIVEMLLKKPGVDSNVVCRGNSALIVAAQNGHEGVVQLLLGQTKIAPNLQAGTKKRNALMAAVMKGRAAMVNVLIARPDINLNAQDSEGNTALMLAAMAGRIEILQSLLSRPRILINTSNERGWTALAVAAAAGRSAIVKLLLDRPEIIILNNREHNRLIAGWVIKEKIETTKMLLDRADLSDELQVEIFLNAVEHGNWELFKILINRKKPCITITVQQKALKRAISFNRQGIAESLMYTPGIDIDEQDDKGKTSLIHAAEHGQTDIVRMLLAKPEVMQNHQDHRGWNALMFAARNGDKLMVQMLLARGGIDVNAQNEDGITALMLPIIEEKVLEGINLDQQHGITLKKLEHEEIFQTLLNYPNININAQTRLGWTALMFAAKLRGEERKTIIQLLLAKPGINLSLQNSNGENALSVAAEYKNINALHVLIAAGASAACHPARGTNE